ncbi:MAG: hypothetical protein KDB00_17020 [Planctomycetales bacterium]|nr:hypothetical protein [Planctomycetales bacterium]
MYRKIRMPLICGFSGIASVILASTNDKGLIIQDTIELGPTGATIFYWGAALVFFTIVAVTAPRIWNSSSSSVSAPASDS